MSFDLYIGSFHVGEPQSFQARVLNDAINPYIVGKEPTCYVLRFSGDESSDCDLYVDTEAERISNFSINRPVSDERLYVALLQVLQLPGTVMYISGDCPPLVGNYHSMAELPPDMVESLGKPVLITKPHEIREYISRA